MRGKRDLGLQGRPNSGEKRMLESAEVRPVQSGAAAAGVEVGQTMIACILPSVVSGSPRALSRAAFKRGY
jgi:hypothetical protein